MVHFYMWRRVACCVEKYKVAFVSIDHNLDMYVYEYLRMPLCTFICIEICLCLFNSLLSHSLSLTGVPPDLYCLPHFEVKRTSCFWTSRECYEFIMGASRNAARLCCTGLTPHSSSQACHWLGMNYSSFFIFFFEKNIDHRFRDRPACVTVGLYDGTPSEPTSSLSHIVYTRSFLSKNFLFTHPLPLAFVSR